MKVWDCVQKTLLLYQSKSTIYHMKRLLLSLLLVLMLSFMKAFALQTPLTFYRLGIRDGLSNSQINSVFKDSKGYIWFGTASGLDRFDGFRFSNFFHKAEDKTSLLNDVVNEIQEDAASDLWVSTGSGYCRFIRKQGVFDIQLQAWMQARGMKGVPYYMKIDKQKNMWLGVRKHGVYYYDIRKKKAFLFSSQDKGRRVIQESVVTDIAEDNGCAVLIYDDGTLVKADGMKHRVVWVDKTLKIASRGKFFDYRIFIDKTHNLWLTFAGKTKVWSASDHRWYDSADAFLVAKGYTIGKDGALWFGSFNGGLTCYKDGRFKAYRASTNGKGLVNDNVWALKTEENGNIVIATLGGGLQLLNPQTGQFTTYTTHNSPLVSNFLSSIAFDLTGNILMGHAQEYSILDAKTHKIRRLIRPKSHKFLSVSSINQIFVDSRGLLWNAGSSGLSVYDSQSDSLMTIPLFADRKAGTAYAIAEDLSHTLWVTTDQGVSHLVADKDEGRWNFFVTNYTDVDGLQDRQFNSRAILLCKNGTIVVGGQDGINLLTPQSESKFDVTAKALFSGLLVFNQPVRVGDDYNGHIILDEELHDGGKLKLNHDENAFTIQLSSDAVCLPNRCRFLYRLKGFDDKWLQTTDGQPAVTFTNLTSGSYTLEVKVVNADGTQSSEVSRLKILIRPPFYLSAWAYACYFVLFCLLFYVINRILLRRANDRMRIEQVTREAEQARRLDKMKLDFFANISHELRAPLSLILSPLSVLISQEHDKVKKTKLQLISRNATRLLGLVNQVLDFRKIDEDCQQMKLVTGDVILFVRDICNTFLQLMGQHKSLTFYSSVDEQMMSFDAEKLRRIMENLLSNAYKYTPDGGRIDVALRVIMQGKELHAEGKQLEIKVSDTGVGIEDEAKAHVFERFYQAPHEGKIVASGSGIGLSIVKKFVEMHGGKVSVTDNPGGGTVFICLIPLRKEEGVPMLIPSNAESEEVDMQNQLQHDVHEDVFDDEVKSMALRAEGTRKADLLIVDDSEDYLAFMAEVLSQYYHVRVAHHGKEALESIKVQRPDVILSDVMMPEMDGNTLCKTLKGDRNTCDIPFIMLTARVADAHKLEGLALGADDYITKPFSIELLILRINNLIKWHNGTKNKLVDPKIKQVKITSMDEKMVKDATEYVENNLSNADISVESLSASLAMSRVQLYKRLLSITGLTPSEFIRNIRLRHAEQLLRQSQRSVSEIAYQVGFNNPRYFSRYFSEMYGVTPSVYKQRYGK